MVKRSVSKKHTFTLEGVSVRDVINAHFGGITTTLSSPDSTPSSKPKPNANIEIISSSKPNTDIAHENDTIGKRALYFFDSRKTRVKLWPVMVDATQNDALPLYTDKPCRNCHHGFVTHPIGCPVKYNKHLSDDVDVKKVRITKFLDSHNLPTDTNDFFETENLFCSWPCLKSYIFSCMARSPHSQKYKESLSYMSLMYKKIYGVKIPAIECAPPIEVLLAYGGHMTIEEYRKSFGVLTYSHTINTRRPYMFSCSEYVEETKARI